MTSRKIYINAQTVNGSELYCKISKSQLFQLIRHRQIRAFVNDPDGEGKYTEVKIVSYGKGRVRTKADATTANNLDKLPRFKIIDGPFD